MTSKNVYGFSYFDLNHTSVNTTMLCVLDWVKPRSTVGPFLANTAQLDNIAQLATHMAHFFKYIFFSYSDTPFPIELDIQMGRS